MPLARSPCDHDQPDGERDRHQHVGDGDPEVRPRALVEAQQGERVLVQRQRPQAEDREPRQARHPRGRSRASEIGPANGSAIAATTVAPQNSAAKPVDTTPRGALVGQVVEAKDRLDDPEPHDDARGDHRREHHLGRAVVGSASDSACRCGRRKTAISFETTLEAVYAAPVVASRRRYSNIARLPRPGHLGDGCRTRLVGWRARCRGRRGRRRSPRRRSSAPPAAAPRRGRGAPRSPDRS